MLLADKIVTLRKRAGWSQEELAAQLGVSRQSVSKWEGAQSVPDMQKVVQMSRLFGVTIDYLLKEELGEPEPAPAESDAPLRCVPMEQAADYLALRQAAFAPRHTQERSLARCCGSSGQPRVCSTAQSWRSCAGSENDVPAGE